MDVAPKEAVNPHQVQSQNLAKYWDPNLSHIERVILEIVETERTYVKDLQEIIEGYLLHIINMENGCLSSDRKACLTSEQTINLFGNIEDIYKFNASFLDELEKQGFDPVGIARCFVRRASGFDVYTQYCTHYPRTVALITDLMRAKETAEIFKERQLTLKQSLPLGSYLLKPVQRILKYHLLLENIVKKLDKDSSAYVDMKDALSVMTNIASHINDMKRKHEHAVRVQEIQSLLCGWEGHDLTTYGELVVEGAFRMYGAKAFRHLFLFEKMLLVTKKKEEGTFCYKAHILCSNLMLIESIKGEPLCFHTIPFDNPKVQYTFQSKNLDQKREWCLQLKRVMLENYNAVIPSHAKQIVMELGQSSQEEKPHSSGKRTLSAPEYLERRKQDRRKSDILNNTLHKGFKLRKSLKKLQSLDGINTSRRLHSARHDESATTPNNSDDAIERRSSSGSVNYEENRETSKTLEDQIEKCQLSDENEKFSEPSSRILRSEHHENGEAEDYVNFYFGNNRLRRSIYGDDSGVCSASSSTTSYSLRTGTPLSSGSSELSMSSFSQSEDSVTMPKFMTTNAFRNTTNLTSSPIVRRVQSFTGMARAKAAMIQHTLSFRHSPNELPLSPLKRCLHRPNTLSIYGNSVFSAARLPSTSSLEEMSPIAPAMWLKKQEQHFASSCKKGGSLPRSFESSTFSSNARDLRSLVELMGNPSTNHFIRTKFSSSHLSKSTEPFVFQYNYDYY